MWHTGCPVHSVVFFLINIFLIKVKSTIFSLLKKVLVKLLIVENLTESLLATYIESEVKRRAHSHTKHAYTCKHTYAYCPSLVRCV